MTPHSNHKDQELFDYLQLEHSRQETHLELIASENFVTQQVMDAMGSILTNKYAEGYPGRRYYGGCQHVDSAEDLARNRIKEIFGAQHANVQPHSGAQANMAAMFTFLDPGDKIMGMSLTSWWSFNPWTPSKLSVANSMMWCHMKCTLKPNKLIMMHWLILQQKKNQKCLLQEPAPIPEPFISTNFVK